MTFSIVIMVGRGYFLPTHVHEASEIEIGYPGVARAKDKTGRRKTWRGIRYVDDAD